MINREKLIKILECCHEDDCGHCPACHTDGRLCDGATELSIPVPVFIFDDVLALLKEQEAKPVIVTTNAYGTRFYHCPKCNRELLVYPRQLYCSNCGQKVKWDA